ncbi:hypothetical protein [Enterocloster lavalensis]|uniref:hypothetical protein n=1 Tax=Enterocloster lavalensis TaxID=460384 RepID=UPI001D084CB2|nr:hypothetical protein [Enterocloster lavalensis]MCB6343620.1 hypothetical protein [Enterocloster lavalensis]
MKKEYLFVGGYFEVNRIFLIKEASSEEEAYDILCEKNNISAEIREKMRSHYHGILVEYNDGYFETDDL